MAAQPNVLEIQVPDYPDKVDWDLPTAMDPALDLADGNKDLEILLEIPPFQNDDDWIQESVQADDYLRPLVHSPVNTCYRNSALAALMNLSPFLNFIQRVMVVQDDGNKILPPLAALADVFRNSGPGEEKPPILATLMSAFWTELSKAAEPNEAFPKPLEGWGHGQKQSIDDPSQFILYLFQRIVEYDLSPDQIDPGTDVGMTDMFKRLFESALISRTPFRCECGNIKRRQMVSRRGFMMDMNFQRLQDLEDGIADNLWSSTEGRTKAQVCSVCGAAASTQAEFYKFVYLPEVLMFSITYVRNSGRNISTARVNYPELLDMSKLRDDPNGRAADRNCLYKLQSIVASSNMATPMGKGQGTHFIAWLRRSATEWTLLNDVPVNVQQVSLDDIRKDKYRPKVLMYVREYPPEDEEKTGDPPGDERKTGDPLGNNGKTGDLPEDKEKAGGRPRDKKKTDDLPEDKGKTGDLPGDKRKTGDPPRERQSRNNSPSGDGLRGPLENNPDLYPPVQTMAPTPLMNIIRAAGARRQTAGVGPRGSLRVIRRSARVSIAASRQRRAAASRQRN